MSAELSTHLQSKLEISKHLRIVEKVWAHLKWKVNRIDFNSFIQKDIFIHHSKSQPTGNNV